MPQPGLANRWEDAGDRLVLTLRDDARFSNGEPLEATDVIWSWRRALRPSTRATDLRPLESIQGGAALARRSLLRIGPDGAEVRRAPYAAFVDGPLAPSGALGSRPSLPAGTAVTVRDTNTRVPCCDKPVPLRRDPTEDAPAVDALAIDDVGIVIALRVMDGVVYHQLRAPSGSAGWARDDELAIHIPAIGLVHVVDRGATVPLLSGPDAGAPARGTLVDEDVVEVVERGPVTSRVVHVASGRMGWLDNDDIDTTVRERRWYLVEAEGTGPLQEGWVPEEDLVFDPELLQAFAVDEKTIEIRLATNVENALRALAEPLLRPVPARLVESYGKEWTRPERIATSGPFHLAAHSPGTRIVLARSSTSFLAERARVERVELVILKNHTSALHLYRAGLLDAILDGALPPDLGGTLSRASDWVRGPGGGGLVAPEVRGFTPVPDEMQALRLRDVTVAR